MKIGSTSMLLLYFRMALATSPSCIFFLASLNNLRAFSFVVFVVLNDCCAAIWEIKQDKIRETILKRVIVFNRASKYLG